MSPTANPSPDIASELSRNVTQDVLDSLQQARGTRLGDVIAALVEHAHELAREMKLTPDELFAAASFLTECGKISDNSRHEFLLLFDTLGLTMVVDTVSADLPPEATQTSVLGPFYRAESPAYPNGADISRGAIDGEPVIVTGTVKTLNGTPVPGAQVEVWGTNQDGFYENIDPDQPEYNLRGRFTADAQGSFALRTVKPVSYPVPNDGPAGLLLYRLNRHNFRPAHLHFIVSAPGFRTVITELFTRDDPYIDSDAVFGVKDDLLVDYEKISNGDGGTLWALNTQFVLAPGEAAIAGFTTGRAEHTADV